MALQRERAGLVQVWRALPLQTKPAQIQKKTQKKRETSADSMLGVTVPKGGTVDLNIPKSVKFLGSSESAIMIPKAAKESAINFTQMHAGVLSRIELARGLSVDSFI
jgi:hypothetical protein